MFKEFATYWKSWQECLQDKTVVPVTQEMWVLPNNLEVDFGAERMILVLTGATGSGKDEVRKRLDPAKFELVRTYTTRDIRDEEREEVVDPYQRVAKAEFLAMRTRGDFIEHNADYDAEGTLFGTKRSDVEAIWAKGKIPVLRIDPNGAQTWRKIIREQQDEASWGTTLLVCYVVPEGWRSLGKRLVRREMGRKARPGLAGAVELVRNNRWMVAKRELPRMDEADVIMVNPTGLIEAVVRDVEELVWGVREMLTGKWREQPSGSSTNGRRRS